MKWGRKKPSSSSTSFSSQPFMISHVFRTSWLTKFKQMRMKSGPKQAKERREEAWSPAYMSSPRRANVVKAGRFYGGDDGDAYWRLSFGEESIDGRRSKGVLRSGRYKLDNDEPEFPPSSCLSCRSQAARRNGNEDEQKFSNMVADVKIERELPRDVEKKVAEIRTPRPSVEKYRKSWKPNKRILEKMQLEFSGEMYKAETKNIFRTETGRTRDLIDREDCKLRAFDSGESCNIDAHVRKIEEETVFSAQDENSSWEWQKLKEMKIQELKRRSEKQRTSLYISGELERKRPKRYNKVRAFCPRRASRVETCKIKALEDMKKAKLKMKKRANKETAMERFKGLESFAVVKCSFDPQKDFRDSMIEMIREKQINKPVELEELLACYLTLNSDVYHDLIIKVFRQVWFELNEACCDPQVENEKPTYSD